jgi:hypothetical protein
MRHLRGVTVPASVSEEALADLKKALPKAEVGRASD